MPLTELTRICVDIGASHVRVASSEGARIDNLSEYRVAELERDHGGDFLLGLEEAIASLAAALPVPPDQAPPPIGIGVACVVDAAGVMLAPLGTSIGIGSALRDRIAARFGTPVTVDNDASLAALGEAVHGAGRGEPNLALITLGSNIGMGIVANGAIYRGARGAAGEVGTLPLRLAPDDTATWDLVAGARAALPDLPVPPRGYVWTEELYGGKALANALTAARRDGPADAGRLDRVLRAANDGDRVAWSIVERAVEGWALTIATVCGVLDPGRILLGGGIIADLKPYLPALRAAVRALMPGTCPPIDLATLGTVAGLVGAGVVARDTSGRMSPVRTA